MSTPPIVNNVKARFSVNDPCRTIKAALMRGNDNSFALTVQTYSNFSVVRLAGEKYVYTVWEKKLDNKTVHVNVCGVRNFYLLEDAILVFCLYFDINRVDIVSGSIRVDNSTFSAHLSPLSFIDLSSTMKQINCRKQEGIVALIHPQYKGRLIVRFVKSGEKVGSLIISARGKYSIVGCKSEKKADSLYCWIQKYLLNLNTEYNERGHG